jgi:hypothetical protein
MGKFSPDELKQRAFERTAWVLKHFYDEQAEEFERKASLHSRVFDTLIYDEYICIGKSEALAKQGGNGHREHVVPCAYIRDCAFKMYQQECTVNDVARMIGRLLIIAFVTQEEADLIDKRYRSTMPNTTSL